MAKRIQHLTAAQFEALFPNEDACHGYLVSRRWPNGVRCARCGSKRVYPLKTMKWKWECPDCRKGGAYRFSHLVGTIFENTNIDLRLWLKVIHLMLTSKEKTSPLDVQRFTGLGSYKIAWNLLDRVRAALQDKEFKRLMGIVGR
jgi:Transposase zinc-ribbon domain